ncbi:MAG: transglycosylase SLT domain-containing protein [Pseudomonadota bacterium]|nr:lytic transglycosylase domain-containing protein [Pseudomonadota bacterium]QKK06100.1 MAG: transglycosylase SLT domain-containing protein [Pseudomonadota bacterium]
MTQNSAAQMTANIHANIPKAVLGAIKNASAKTGVDFSYLMAQASAESSFNPKARAKSSSATGLFQFLDQTWLQMVKKYGAEHGMGDYAEKISLTKSGRAVVADAATRQEILNLRKDPEKASLMAAEMAAENGSRLEARLGRKVDAADLYMAHFLGAGGATQFLKTLDHAPQKKADALLPEAAKANSAVFYDRAGGKARSVSDVYALLAGKFSKNVLKEFAAEGGSDAVMTAAAGAVAVDGTGTEAIEIASAAAYTPRPAYGRAGGGGPVTGQTLSPALIWAAAEMTSTIHDMVMTDNSDDDNKYDRDNRRGGFGRIFADVTPPQFAAAGYMV